MSDDIAIRVENLSKCYPIFEKPRDRLKQMVLPCLAKFGGLESRKYFREFWALRDVSFEVRKGEAVGILGRNGAGKSTLLQIISGTLAASSGAVEVNGRVAALLELGSGFNPEFSGRENVYLSGAILGLCQSQISSRFEEVAAFADIGEFLDQPVKTYSSGMLMRLAFAVNTFLSPDILIVDEALGVGDAPFQAKCFRRLRQLIEEGVSLLFVSHDLATVRSVCSRALWLKAGYAEKWGEAQFVAKAYEKFCWAEQGVVVASSADLPTQSDDRDLVPTLASAPAGAALPLRCNHLLPVVSDDTRLGDRTVELVSVVAAGVDGEPRLEFDFDETITLHYHLRARSAVDSDCVIGVRLRDVQGNHVLSAHNLESLSRLSLVAGQSAYATVTFRAPVTHGAYILRTGIFGFRDGSALEHGRYEFSRAIFWDIRENALSLKIRPFRLMPLAGPVHLHAATLIFPLHLE